MEATEFLTTYSRHRELVAEFLAQKTLAVVGVSRTDQSPANGIHRKLRSAGYTVVAVNPAMRSFEGETCYARLSHAPVSIDGVVTVTRPEVTHQIVADCIEAGIARIWMHNLLGTNPRIGRALAEKTGSTDRDAVWMAEAAGLTVIAGGCPMQHVPPVDPFHRCVLWTCQKLGNYGVRGG